MNNSHQLIKKDKSLVYPKTFLDAIKSRETGQTLNEILQGFNMYFVSYNGNIQASRCLVPIELRKKGLWITYIDFSNKVKTEWYNSDKLDNESWGNSNNWNDASNSLVGDLSISTDGYWIINGEKTTTKAQGPAGEIPLSEINKINEGLIEASKASVSAKTSENYANLAKASASRAETYAANVEKLLTGEASATPTTNLVNLVAQNILNIKLLDNQLNGEKQIIDLSTLDWSRGNISYIGNVWENTSSGNYLHQVIEVTEGEIYELHCNNSSHYAFLNTYIVPDTYKNPGNDQLGKTPDYAIDNVKDFSDGDIIEIPVGCHYLYLLTMYSNLNKNISVKKILSTGGVVYDLQELDKDINKLQYVKKIGVSNNILLNSLIRELFISSNKSFKFTDVKNIRIVRRLTGYLQMYLKNSSGDNLFFNNIFEPAEQQIGFKLVDEIYFCLENLPSYPNEFDYTFDCILNERCSSLDLNPIIKSYILGPEGELQSADRLLKLPITTTGSSTLGTTLLDLPVYEGKIQVKGSSDLLYSFYINIKYGNNEENVWASGNKQAGNIDIVIDLSSILKDNLYIKRPDFKSVKVWYNRFYSGTITILNVAATNNIIEYLLESASDTRYNLFWKGKNIGWWGTSIPAGDESKNIPFKGKKITAKHHLDEIVQTNGSTCILEYPVMTGVLLGANVYNEAMGSSQVAKSISGSDLLLRCKALALKVQDTILLLLGCYNINWENKTYSRNINNDYGITSFLKDSTWEELMSNFAFCLRLSYEISLVSRYLISDNIEHSNYVSKIFGSYYTLFSSNIDLTNLCKYLSDLDLFVFDHGVNDGNFASNPESTNTETFEGAYNMLFSTIYKYKPSARIVIVSSYTRMKNAVNEIEIQENMAKRWLFPFIDMSKLLPLTKKITILTRGYWDNNKVWHDNGFTWSETSSSYTTNNAIFIDSLSSVKLEFEPLQIDGIWYWKTTPLRTWLYDNLHPHSDNEGRICKEYARILSEFFTAIGNAL